jgi:hypothetical protein
VPWDHKPFTQHDKVKSWQKASRSPFNFTRSSSPHVLLALHWDEAMACPLRGAERLTVALTIIRCGQVQPHQPEGYCKTQMPDWSGTRASVCL